MGEAPVRCYYCERRLPLAAAVHLKTRRWACEDLKGCCDELRRQLAALKGEEWPATSG